jgi:hypothetical protein
VLPTRRKLTKRPTGAGSVISANQGGAPSFRVLCGGWVAKLSTSRSINLKKEGNAYRRRGLAQPLALPTKGVPHPSAFFVEDGSRNFQRVAASTLRKRGMPIDDAPARLFQRGIMCSILVSASFIEFLKAAITLKFRSGLMALCEKPVFGQSDTRQNLAGPE